MFDELVRKNRSHREFEGNAKIPAQVIHSWLENASVCPAAMNMQVLKYKILDTRESVLSLMPLTRWATSLGKKLPPQDGEPSVFIVICHDTDIAPEKPIFMIDVGIVAQTIMLSATEDGYGGCIIGSADSEAVASHLSLPQNLVPKLILGIGVPCDTVVLTQAKDGQVKYFRDELNVHYVPKRPVGELIVK